MEVLTKDKAFRLLVANINLKTLKKFNVKVVAERQKQVALFTTLLLRVAAGLNSINDSTFDLDDEPTVELGNWGLEKKKHLLQS